MYKRLGHIMSPQEYDKIVDKLLQFRGKLPLSMHLFERTAQDKAELLRLTLDLLIQRIDEFAKADERGWIR